jgi:hypothetical protein
MFKVDPGDMDKLRKVVQNWDDFSPEGVNGLASRLSDFYTGSANSIPEDSIVSGLNRTIRSWIGEQYPDIAEANAKYADKMGVIEQLNSILRIRRGQGGPLGQQQTAEAITRLFNANRDLQREGVQILSEELGIDLAAREAGRQLSSGTLTKFQAGAGDVVKGTLRELVPKQTLAKLVALTGKSAGAIESQIGTLAPAARGAVVELLTDLLAEGEPPSQPGTQR